MPLSRTARGQRLRGEAIPLALLALLTLVAGALRRYHLGQQSLWFDEADLVIRAREPLGQLLRNFVHPGENGPLYTLGLACWMKVFGTSEVAVRLPSAIAGTLAIPAFYGLGRALRGSRLGLIAAALLTISPYAHWYAQDAKMYSLLVLLTIVSTWLLLIAVRRGGAAWFAYGVVAAATLFVHATFIFLLVAHIAVAVVLWRRGDGVWPAGREARWLGIIIGIAVLPLAVWGVAFAAGHVPTWQVQATPWAIVRRMLVEFSVTHRADASTQQWGVTLAVALAALGVGLTWYAAPRSASGATTTAWSPRAMIGIVLGITLIPGLLFLLISLRQPVFEPRYLTVVLPGFLLLVALGLDGLLRWRPTWLLAAMGGCAVVWLASMPLRDVNLSTLPQKEDWREAYRHLGEHARAGDGVVVYPGYLRTTYDYYALRFPALRDLPVITPPSLAPETDISDRALVAFFASNTRGWERAWLVESPERAPTQDPDGRIIGYYASGIPALPQAAQTLFEKREYNGVLLDCYTYDGPFDADHLRPPILTNVSFGETGIVLLGAALQTRDGTQGVQRGTFAPLLLRWVSPDARAPVEYIVLVRLVDAAGREVGRYDIPPLDGHWPTNTWEPKDDPYDPHDLLIPPDLSPGPYRVLVGLAPRDDPAHPLPIRTRDGSRADTNGLLPIMTITVT